MTAFNWFLVFWEQFLAHSWLHPRYSWLEDSNQESEDTLCLQWYNHENSWSFYPSWTLFPKHHNVYTGLFSYNAFWQQSFLQNNDTYIVIYFVKKKVRNARWGDIYPLIQGPTQTFMWISFWRWILVRIIILTSLQLNSFVHNKKQYTVFCDAVVSFTLFKDNLFYSSRPVSSYLLRKPLSGCSIDV